MTQQLLWTSSKSDAWFCTRSSSPRQSNKLFFYYLHNKVKSSLDCLPDIPSTGDDFVFVGSSIGPPSFCKETRLERPKNAVNHQSGLGVLQLQFLSSGLFLQLINIQQAPPTVYSLIVKSYPSTQVYQRSMGATGRSQCFMHVVTKNQLYLTQ